MRTLFAVFLSLLVFWNAAWGASADAATEIIAGTVDIPIQQIMLDIRMVSISENGARILGISGEAGQGPYVFEPEERVQFTEYVVGPPAGTLGWDYVPLPWGAHLTMGATLSMLVSKNAARVTALPRIMTRSGHPVDLLVGDRFPVAHFDPRSDQLQVEMLEVGTRMSVNPVASAHDYVSLDITQDVSSLVEGPRPSTRVAHARSHIMVHDGNTILLGGFLHDLESATPQTRQILADLPVLGEFFRGPIPDPSRSRFFITITPKVMP